MDIAIVCPVCHNIGETTGKFKPKKCFYSPAKDVWHCYHCDSKGKGNPEMQGRVLNFTAAGSGSLAPQFEFTEELLKAYQKELTSNEAALEYVRKRLNGADGQTFGLGYDAGRDAIVIPLRNLDDELVGVKYRFLTKTDPRYISEPGSKATLYVLKGELSKVLIVEGEFDAMAARAMGFTGTIAAVQTNRVNQASQEKLRELCKAASIIIIAADADEAGEKLWPAVVQAGVPESKLAALGELPKGVKDIGELAETKQTEVFQALIVNARTAIEQLSFNPLDRLQETWDFLANRLNTQGWPTGFRMLDDKLGGGLMPYTLTALSAPGKTGKTTFIIQLIHNLITRNIKTAFISLEMGPTTHVIPSLLSILLQSNVRRLSSEDLTQKIEKNADILSCLTQLTFMDRYGITPAELIEEWIRNEAAKGVQVFFMDHVGYSLLDIKDAAEHSNLSKRLRGLTRELPIHIIAVVQPKQIQAGQRVTKHDLYGSVTWSQDTNQVMTLERNGADQVNVRLTDSHNPLAKPSDEAVVLFYEHGTCSLRE